MRRVTSAITVSQIVRARDTLQCILTNKKIQMAVKGESMQDFQWLKNMDEQVAMKIAIDVLMEEGKRITSEEP